MKVLLDTCVWGGAVDAVKSAGHDVIWAGSWPKDPGDNEILSIAHHDERVLVTLDKDFGKLAVVYNQPHSGIIRIVDFSARQQAAVCLHVLAHYQRELSAGAVVTAEPSRVRIHLQAAP